MDKNLTIAYFISSHGFGHAARSTAVMQSLLEKSNHIQLEIFTQTPDWFFAESLKGNFRYHNVQTDVGLSQSNPLFEDVGRTLLELGKFYPLKPDFINSISNVLRSSSVDLVLCDISPLGILAARQAGIPSVLVENFTWDWIYQNYLSYDRQYNAYIQYLVKIFSLPDFHIKTIPYCQENGQADLLADPVDRKPVKTKGEVRRSLGIGESEKVVLVSMGGIPENFKFIKTLQKLNEVRFIIPEGGITEVTFENNCVRLPHHSEYYHPDLVNSADLVLGKAGYSTISEVYHAGIPFAFFSRPTFREAEVLQAYIENEMAGVSFNWEDFEGDIWKIKILDLLKLNKFSRPGIYGNDQIADFILSKFGD